MSIIEHIANVHTITKGDDLDNLSIKLAVDLKERGGSGAEEFRFVSITCINPSRRRCQETNELKIILPLLLLFHFAKCCVALIFTRA